MYFYKYPRAAITVDAIVIAKAKQLFQILLIKRGNEPFKGMWALPGGFINLDETLEESCKRELFEETGIKTETLQQFKTFDAVNRDPRHRTLSVVFYTFLDDIIKAEGMDDASDAKWLPLKNLPALAFDHSEIIRQFISEKGLTL